jgi:hypothetical protein
MVGMAASSMVVGLPPTPLVGLAAALVVAAALGMGVVSQRPVESIREAAPARPFPAVCELSCGHH